MRTRKVVLNMQKEPLMFDFINSSSFHSIYCDFLLPHQLAHRLNMNAVSEHIADRHLLNLVLFLA